MDDKRDLDNHRNNMMYYNQMVRDGRAKKSSNVGRVAAQASFSSQKVDFSDYLLAPSGYEGIFYTIYFLTIPYVLGATFLFFFIAKGNYGNFMLLDTTAFLIVWMIGYEIIASLLLIAIFISFLRYEKKPKNSR